VLTHRVLGSIGGALRDGRYRATMNKRTERGPARSMPQESAVRNRRPVMQGREKRAADDDHQAAEPGQ
jgi:hypothetical protein